MALLKAFNPHELSADVVVAVATGRDKELEHILSVIRNNLSAPVIQHIIVSAPRGYGKSFFLRYLEVRVSEIAEKENLPIAMALLPEELPHVKEPDTLIAEVRRTFLRLSPESVEVRWIEDDGVAWDECVETLDRSIDKHFGDRKGLLIAGVENFDLLAKKAFAKPGPSGRLREFLTRPGNRVMLLAASARGAIDAEYDRPLFKVFEEVPLQPWTIDQTIDFLVAQRKAGGRPPLTEAQLGRAKAVAAYISGTPRLATLIGEALLDHDPLGAADVLDKLIDELTPYYKERIEILPARSQVLLDALLRGGERCSATELAKRVGAPSQSAIAAPLDDLRKDLLVVGEKAPKSAEVLLRVTDRVFAHYYRKRILSHGQETCPLEALVEILSLLYSPEEKRREAEKFAARGLKREAAIMMRLWEEDQSLALRSSAQVSESEGEDSEFDVLISDWTKARENGQLEDALSRINDALARSRIRKNIMQELRALVGLMETLRALGRIDEAVLVAQDVAAKALTARVTVARSLALRYIARGYLELNQYDKAFTAGRDAAADAANAEDKQQQSEMLVVAAIGLIQLSKFEEALPFATQAAEVAASIDDEESEGIALRWAALCLNQMNRHSEAVTSAFDAVNKLSKSADIDNQLLALTTCTISLLQLNQADRAEATARDAFERAAASSPERPIDPMSRLGVAAALLLTRTLDVPMALKAYGWLIDNAVSTSTEKITSQAARSFFDCISDIVTRDKAWPDLIASLRKSPTVAAEISTEAHAVSAPGQLISETFAIEGFERSLSLAKHVVGAVAAAIQEDQDERLRKLWHALVDSSIDVVASRVDGPEMLRSLADVLNAYSGMFPRAEALVRAAAAYHAAGRDPQALARLDPDLATMIITVFPPETAKERPKRRVRKKRQRHAGGR